MKPTTRIALILSLLAMLGFACSFTDGFSSGLQDSSSSESSGDILFQDDFSDSSSGWSTLHVDNDAIDYVDGGLRFTLNEANYDYWSNPSLYLTNVHIEVDATKLSGPDDNDFGVICRYQDENNFYGLLISSDGYYGISKMVDGEHTLISGDNMMYSKKINQGGTTNHIAADCDGSTLRLFVNGDLLAEVEDTDYTGGDIGLLAGTFDETGVDILFDNMVVTKP